MSRLIDADALMKYYLRLSDECFKENEHDYAIFYDNVCAKIMEQPTAYDVEKVIAELKEKENFFGTPSMGSLQKFGYCMGINHAIDIVRKGGIE